MDLLITCEMDTLISCTIILPDLLSGHQVVVWVIDLLQPPATCITVAHQKTQDIDVYAFQKDICCVFYKESVDDLDDVITTYDNTLHLLLDKYAPQQTHRPHAPWSSEYLQELKHVKRCYEGKFQFTKSSIDMQIYYQACCNYIHLFEVT